MLRKFHLLIVGVVIISGLAIHYQYSVCHDKGGIRRQSITANYERPSTAYPSATFFENLANYYHWMEGLQARLDQAAKTRQGVIGNIAWHPSQLYYYARSASDNSVGTICEIGYGAGHSTILYLTVNPAAHVYSFDIFPNNSDDQVHTPRETVSRQQAFQAVTLSTIKNNASLASRFHKIIGDSNITIPDVAKKKPSFQCDFLSIDGSHNPPQPFFDILHSQSLCHKHTIVVLDDMESQPMKEELNKALRLGIVYEYECLKPEYRVDLRFSSLDTYHKEFCVARYTHAKEKILSTTIRG